MVPVVPVLVVPQAATAVPTLRVVSLEALWHIVAAAVVRANHLLQVLVVELALAMVVTPLPVDRRQPIPGLVVVVVVAVAVQRVLSRVATAGLAA